MSSCPRVFANPKARRLHLISVHAYPKEYFFAITNKGIGGLLRRWGEGASLLRGQWRPRDNNDEDEDDGAEDDGASLPPSSILHSDDSDGPDGDHHDGEGVEAGSAAPAVNGDGKAETEKMSEDNVGDDAVDALTQDVSALGLVPSSVRFGRGSGRGRAGLATRGGRSAARHLGHMSHPAHPRQQSQVAATTAVGDAREEDENENANEFDAEDSEAMEQDAVVVVEKSPSTRGRRGRGRAGGGGGGGGPGGGRGIGRGRGGFVPPPPRAGFLARGGAGHSRGFPRGLIVRGRGRGALV